MLKNYKATSGQSIYDVCLQVYGTLDRVYKLCKDNGRTISDEVGNGQIFIYDTAFQQNQQIIALGYTYATWNQGAAFSLQFDIQFG